MANRVSLELCRELHKLSGWEPDGTWINDGTTTDGAAPQYSLGYLLRKLPPTISECPDGVLTLYIFDGEWACGYEGGEVEMFRPGAIPENAAAKLAIQLFKQGILTRPQHGHKEK